MNCALGPTPPSITLPVLAGDIHELCAGGLTLTDCEEAITITETAGVIERLAYAFLAVCVNVCTNIQLSPHLPIVVKRGIGAGTVARTQRRQTYGGRVGRWQVCGRCC